MGPCDESSPLDHNAVDGTIYVVERMDSRAVGGIWCYVALENGAFRYLTRPFKATLRFIQILRFESGLIDGGVTAGWVSSDHGVVPVTS